MALTGTLTNVLRQSDGTLAVGIVVTAALVPTGGFRIDDSSEITAPTQVITNGSGVWSMTLEQTSNIFPAGSYWEITENLISESARIWTVAVGSGTQTLRAALVSPPLPQPLGISLAGNNTFSGTTTFTGPVVGIGSSVAVGNNNNWTGLQTFTQLVAAPGFDTTSPVRGPPTTGTWAAGNFVVDGQGELWVCTAGGTPGTWKAGTVLPFATAAARDAAITSPVAGMVAVLTTNDALEGLSSRNSAGVWRPPWNLPWGVVGKAQTIATQAAITTVVDVTSLTVTWTAVANRIYRTSVILPVNLQNTASGTAQLIIADGANNNKQVTNNDARNPAAYYPFVSWVYETGIGAGSTTRKARVTTSAGTLDVAPAATFPAQIIVEDLGPNGAPA